MQFSIIIKYDRKNIRLIVELIERNKDIEKFRIIAKNQSFVMQGNRPMLIAKRLKHFPVTWKVIEGGYNQPYILEQIQKAIFAKLNES